MEELCGQNVKACNHCLKCTAGCPFVDNMDLLPNQVIRCIQLGQEDEVMKSKTPWLCASCFTCVSRCPKGVDLSKIMEAIRTLLLRQGKEHINLSGSEFKRPADAPQQLFVSGSRKLSG